MAKKDSAASKLMDAIDALEAEELRLEERLLARRGGRATALVRVGVLCAAACVCAGVWAWCARGSGVGAAARLVPLGVAAAAGALGWALVSCCCDLRCVRDERRLAGVYSDARDKARLLRDEVDYDRTLQLLARMDRPTPRKPGAAPRLAAVREGAALCASAPAGGVAHEDGAARSAAVNGHEVVLRRLVCARCHYNNGYLPLPDWNTVRLLHTHTHTRQMSQCPHMHAIHWEFFFCVCPRLGTCTHTGFRCRACGSLNARAPRSAPQPPGTPETTEEATAATTTTTQSGDSTQPHTP